jgi:ABC-type uncharacterized transport system involved in gliding motility auxiliary subunit
MQKLPTTLLGLLLGLVLFFGVNILSGATLRTMRVDLTEDELYTLSDGAKNIVRAIDEPLRLTLYYSESLEEEVPQLRDYFLRVRELLEEFELASGGGLILDVVDPEPFTDIEDRAVADGLFGARIPGAVDPFFFGLVATNSTDDQEVIAFFDQSKEEFLEYDLAKIFRTLTNPDRAVVGVLSSLPLQGGAFNPMAPGTPPDPGWLIRSQLESLYDVRTIDTDATELPADLDVLLMIHPRGVSDATQFAIDQFVLGGGKALVYVDPHCEADQSSADPTNPMASMGADRSSDLERLFEAWGLEMVNNKVAGDREAAITVTLRGERGIEEWPFVVYIGADRDVMDESDAVTSGLTDMVIATAGILQPLPGATTEFRPLVHTTEDSMRIDVGVVQFMPDPKGALSTFVSEHEELTLAARISGPAKTAFPDGPPSAGEDGDAAAGPATERLESGDINVIVVADADQLQDRFWIQEDRIGPISLGIRKTSGNGDFCFNAVENMSGGDDLIAIRARGRAQRPFERKEEIKRDAEQRFLQEEEALQAELTEAQQRIDELQREKSPGQEMILSAEQSAALEQAREQQVETRKKLREVQRRLREDIDSLGTRLMLINVALLPGLIVVLALGVWFLNLRRRKR